MSNTKKKKMFLLRKNDQENKHWYCDNTVLDSGVGIKYDILVVLLCHLALTVTGRKITNIHMVYH